MKTPTLAGLAEQVKEWRGRFEALTSSVHEVTQRADAAIAENSSLKDQLAKSNVAALQKRVGELEGRITELEGQLAAAGSNAAAPIGSETVPKAAASGAPPTAAASPVAVETAPKATAAGAATK
jgi:phage shock protein A